VRASVAFFLLTAACAALLAGCGGETKTPAEVVSSWTKALNAGDDDAAAGLFAKGAIIVQVGQQQVLADREDAVSFNASLPCGGRIVKQSVKGAEVTATFTLTRRPGHMCDDTGATAVSVFNIEDGKIALLRQLPPGEAPPESA
jgi:hypothetical protein